jgi:hypothetical protein
VAYLCNYDLVSCKDVVKILMVLQSPEASMMMHLPDWQISVDKKPQFFAISTSP